MPRPQRAADGGLICHTLERANARLAIFESDDDTAFERVPSQAIPRNEIRLLAYCGMPKHFHLGLWPCTARDLSAFLNLLTMTHTQRWPGHRPTSGTGHLYQGRFESHSVQSDEHFLAVCRFVERNALHADQVRRTEDWRWGSL